jgi:hypothetical protein
MIRGYVEKNGSAYRRFKVKHIVDGKPKWRDLYIKVPFITEPGFTEAWERVNAKPAERKAPAKDSVAALVFERRTVLFNEEMAKSTLDNWVYYLGLIEKEHGHRLVADLRKSHVYRIRDAMVATPGKSDNYIAKLAALLEFAVERDWIAYNPARGIPKLSKGEHDPWPAHVIERCLAHADPMLGLAIVTGLCSSQRLSDVIRMQHGWHDRLMMRVPASVKTGTPANIPMHPFWLQWLDKVERRSITILYDRFGRPFSDTDRIQERLRRLMHRLGYVDKKDQLLYTFHGLSKNACCYLIETGLSDSEVAAIVGKTTETVRHYAKQASDLMIAKAAGGRVRKAKIAGLVGKPD